MKKFLIAVLTVMTALFIWTQAAQAAPNDPPPGNGPPELCDITPWLPQCDGGGDSITIDDPTEEECPNGGIVVVFNETRYPICNGANGEDGSNGSDGSNGTDGTDGSNGVDGANGADGAPGAPGANGTDGASAPTCVGPRNRWTLLPARLQGFKKVRLWFNGTRSVVKVKNNRVKLATKGLPCGAYVALIRKGTINRAQHIVLVKRNRIHVVRIGGHNRRAFL